MGDFSVVDAAILITIALNLIGLVTDHKNVDPMHFAIRMFTLRMTLFCCLFALIGACLKLGW